MTLYNNMQIKMPCACLFIVHHSSARSVPYYIHNNVFNTAVHDMYVIVYAYSKEVVRVKATVVEHNKTAKVIVFKKKRRKNYKRKKGIVVNQGFIQDFWLGGGNLLVHQRSAEM